MNAKCMIDLYHKISLTPTAIQKKVLICFFLYVKNKWVTYYHIIKYKINFELFYLNYFTS